MPEVKKIKKPQKIIILLFPYLYMEDGFKIDKYEIKSSLQKYLDKESKFCLQVLMQLQGIMVYLAILLIPPFG